MSGPMLQPIRGGLGDQPRRLPTAPEVATSLIMVVYRTGPALEESLARVLGDRGVDEFIIVDNGSTREEAGFIDAAAARDQRVTVLRGQGNVGFARGANMGAQAAHGAMVVFLNPDAFLQTGCLSALADTLEGRPAPCLVGARVMDDDGGEQRGARRGEVTPITTLLSLTRLSKLKAFQHYEIHHEDEAPGEEAMPVPTISGACFAMRRFDFLEVGGFDVGYFLHVEDVDLCWRVRGSGGSVLFQPKAQVVHLGSTSRTHPMKVEFHKGVGLARYFRKRADTWPRKLLAHALAIPIVLVSVIRPLLRRLRGHGWLR